MLKVEGLKVESLKIEGFLRVNAIALSAGPSTGRLRFGDGHGDAGIRMSWPHADVVATSPCGGGPAWEIGIVVQLTGHRNTGHRDALGYGSGRGHRLTGMGMPCLQENV